MTAAIAIPDACAITIPVRTVSELNCRQHWAARARRAANQRSVTRMAARTGLTRPAFPCSVRLTRIAPRALDDDNLRGALKAVRDGVADWLGINDRDERVGWIYAQERGKPKQYAVHIEILGWPDVNGYIMGST